MKKEYISMYIYFEIKNMNFFKKNKWNAYF